MAKQNHEDATAIASDLVDFLNASPTAFHAVGTSSSLFPQPQLTLVGWF